MDMKKRIETLEGRILIDQFYLTASLKVLS